MINKPKIDFKKGSSARRKVGDEFKNEKWEPFRKWSFENIDKEQRNILSEKFYEFLELHNILFPFVPWFVANYVEPCVSVIERNYKLFNGNTLRAILPPQQSFSIEKDKNILNFNAFSKLFENEVINVTVKQINKILEQQNYTNLYLNVLGEQIISLNTRVEKMIENLRNQANTNQATTSNTSNQVITAPLIQPPPEIKDFKLKNKTNLENILDEKFKGLKINTLEEDFINSIENNKEYKKIISAEEWGLSTLKEKEFIIPELKITFKYNYWDYVKSLEEVFLYENARRKHSWFIKICGDIYNRPIPNWFSQWWMKYGPSIKKFPESFKPLYGKWVKISPKLKELDESSSWIDNIGPMFFFIEFSIRWIWKWSPEVGYTPEQIPCIQRISYTKFWDKLSKIDPETKKSFGQDILIEIEEKIENYEKSQSIISEKSPFQHISRILQMQKGVVTKEEIIQSYMEELKKKINRNI